MKNYIRTKDLCRCGEKKRGRHGRKKSKDFISLRRWHRLERKGRGESATVIITSH